MNRWQKDVCLGDTGHTIIEIGTGRTIARVYNKAHVLMIAAAPEMLEALKVIRIAATTPMLLDNNNKDLTVEAALDLVEAAIAKAEGAE